MRKQLAVVLLAVAGVMSTACMNFPKTQVDLEKVAQDSGLTNVTTGDGNFDNYTAQTYGKTHDIGVALGLGFIKLMELFPARGPEELMTSLAKDAQAAGSTAMINVTPERSLFVGFPFIFIGIYVDQTSGTGIAVK